MSRALPRKPHLDSLRKQARQLVRAHRAANSEAVQRIRKYMPQLRHVPEAALLQGPFSFQSAQCVLAREYGFHNWGELVKAVDVIRQAEQAMLDEVDGALKRGQPLHVLVPKHVSQEVLERIVAHCGPAQVLEVEWPKKRPGHVLASDLANARVVVGSPHALAFPIMYERLQDSGAQPALTGLVSESRAFVNVPSSDERSPLIISGQDQATGVVRDLISMHLTEFYELYGSMADHRY